MLYLYAAAHTLGLKVLDKATTRDERGSITIEQVLWALGVIVFIGIVFAVIRQFVTDSAAKIDDPIK